MTLLTVGYTPSFLKRYKKLEPAFKEAVKKKIEEFRDRENHKKLDVHKLHGKYKDCHAFSIDYRNRVAFTYIDKNKVALLGVSDHDIYK
ncbi:MAG: hypothetical protein COV10_00400 [Candidatus Vogelbacteria bacterium CG10_big_fil_rev_8_21_14_0_10_51_16]|uniref:Type II toxin-antitoxin system mRNA interferase toxin, RelE/StbE family n=1 Tax=Candidatus Vogelbacteria bacterium CG10_big_fil_rev_8_21_14_0_10_51_16 TaxID=1975045 RepID=A0A2H0RGU8_9BACT|nr:MAG: hypothetical protein COV10_00400 [Candidatus Vogelbacteria bacterium CG10_big_fil_rev_8_21_14_0_10_51_16]